jgi:hypothetical protein
MSKAYISAALRQKITLNAHNRCGYCQTQALVTGQPLQIDHITPESAGGSSDEANLWLACVPCNQRKGTSTHALDPISLQNVPLFNPAQQIWDEHFEWVENSTKMQGLTPTGRATIEALKLNRPLLVTSRKRWVMAGWHPPLE